MKTEKEIAIEKARPVCTALGLDKSQFKLIVLLFEGNNTRQIAIIWGADYTPKIIDNLIQVIYRKVRGHKLETVLYVDSHIRLLIAVGLIPS